VPSSLVLMVSKLKNQNEKSWGNGEKLLRKEAHWQVIEGPPLVLLYCPVVPDSHLAQFWNAHTSFTSSSSFHPSLFLSLLYIFCMWIRVFCMPSSFFAQPQGFYNCLQINYRPVRGLHSEVHKHLGYNMVTLRRQPRKKAQITSTYWPAQLKFSFSFEQRFQRVPFDFSQKSQFDALVSIHHKTLTHTPNKLFYSL
jgi:hypothetical protein